MLTMETENTYCISDICNNIPDYMYPNTMVGVASNTPDFVLTPTIPITEPKKPTDIIAYFTGVKHYVHMLE